AFEQVPDIVKTGVPLKYIKNIAQIGDKTIIILNFLKLMKKNFSLYDGYLKDEDIDDDSDDFSEVFEGDSEDTLDISIEDEIEEKVMNNKQNIVDKKISKVRLELNEDQLSAFREIASISTGKIAEALSNLMEPSTKIEIDIQDVGLEDLSDFREKHARKEDLYVAIRSPLTRDFHGVVYLMISVEGLCKLLKKVEIVEDFPDEFEDLNDLDADSVSAINEIGNMIISHYCSGLSNFLKLKMYHESPEVAIAEFTALIDNELVNLMTKSDRGIFSETSIKIDNEDIDGEIVFIPYYESIEQFIEYFEVDRIIELLEQESKQNKITTKTKKTTKKGKKSTKKGKKTTKSKKSTKSKTQKSTAKNKKAKQEEHSEEIMEMVVSQKDFNIDQSILDELNITVSNLDSFRELGNMGAGNAGNSLSEILKEKVFLEIPPANVLNIQELTDSFRDKDRKRVGYMCMSTGFLEGNAFLMYTPEDLKNLLNMVFDKGFKKTIKKTTDLSPMEKKGVIKLLHMLLDGYFKALATFLKIPFEPPKYKFFVQSPKMLFGKIAASLPNKNVRGVIIETNLQVDLDIPMRGQFILLLSAEVFPRILEKMEAVWG
ncbi:MAG: hypothetical protein GY870_22690, partial [archaeon]|nr:hypothetical protein [archaeon]